MGVTFAAVELLPLIAALDQILADGIYFDYARYGGLKLGRWAEPEIEGGWVWVRGPVLAAATRIVDRSFELHYDHVAELRHTLAELANDWVRGDAA